MSSLLFELSQPLCGLCCGVVVCSFHVTVYGKFWWSILVESGLGKCCGAANWLNYMTFVLFYFYFYVL